MMRSILLKPIKLGFWLIFLLVVRVFVTNGFFCKTLRTDGSIEKYKARFIVVGRNQIEDFDFFDTYFLVSKITTIRVLIAIACVFNLNIHQMDVKTIFLNVDLKEEIYMDQPKGFVEFGKEKKVYKLVKSLYGLK